MLKKKALFLINHNVKSIAISVGKFLVAELLIENCDLIEAVDIFSLAAIDYIINNDDEIFNFIKELQ